MSSHEKPLAPRLFRLGLLIAVLAFLALYLRDIDFAVLRDARISWLYLFAATVLALVFRYWGVWVWRGILQDLGAQPLPTFRVLADIFAKSWMARYIPGTLPWIASRVVLAESTGISKSRLATASLLEAIVQVVAIAATAALIMSFDDRVAAAFGANTRALVIIGIVALGVLLVPAVFNRLIRGAYRLVRGHDAYAELSANAAASSRSFIRYALGSLISGLSYCCLVLAVWPATETGDLWFIIGIVNLAAAIGMATPFVPSGMGTRDASLLVLLALVIPKEAALLVTVLSRLWSVGVDLLFLGAANALAKENEN